MDVNNGDILSLVSLPNFNINQRAILKIKNYIIKLLKEFMSLGSIFKTFTLH
jgi:cell division protein FtsI (penicillin-binding protein 3)